MAKIASRLFGNVGIGDFETTVLYDNGLQFKEYSNNIVYRATTSSYMTERTVDGVKMLSFNLPGVANYYAWALIKYGTTGSVSDYDYCVAHLKTFTNQGTGGTYPPYNVLCATNSQTISTSPGSPAYVLRIDPTKSADQAWLVIDMSTATYSGNRWIAIGGYQPSSDPVQQTWYCDYMAFLKQRQY